MTGNRRWWLFALVATAGVCLGGCGQDFASTGGVLLQGFDTLALPGSDVTLTARLQGGEYLKGLEGYLVGFYEGQRKIGESRTDADGVAETAYKAGALGDEAILAKLEDPDVRKYGPPAVEIIVAVRQADAPLLVVDLDRTLVAGSFEDVLLNQEQPIEKSQEVMERAAAKWEIVYLTHRPEIFMSQSKNWLRKYDYPLGPLLVSTMSEFIKGSRAFKSARIGELKTKFTNIQVGVGDKAGDAQAYLDNGMHAILLLHPEDLNTPEEVRAWIRDVKTLPEGPQADVVDSWTAVAEVLFEGKHYPVSAAMKRLVERQDKLIEELLSSEGKGRSAVGQAAKAGAGTR